MSTITLIRHGQANSAATDEAGYDRLSPLGHQQSNWLGTHLRSTKQHFTRLYTGTLRRHVETADGMEMDLEPVRDSRLNELEYFTMAQALQDEHNIPIPTAQSGFAAHLPLVFAAWQKGELSGAPETFASFETRIDSVVKDIAAGDGPALVVTSGGLISNVMQQLMGLDTAATAHVALAIMNSSIHRLHPIGERWCPVMFNAVPHLEHPDRHHAQTHI